MTTVRFFLLAPLVCFGILAAAADPPAGGDKTFKTDGEGFILNWLVLEPIVLKNLQHTEVAVRGIVGAESYKDLLAGMPRDGDKRSVEGTEVQWRELNSGNYVVDLVGFAAANGKPTAAVLFWGVAYVTAPEEMKDVRLAIGSDDDSMWWVNGKEAIHAFGVRQTSTDDNVSKRLTLNKGVNVVRFAVVQGDGPSDCCARFLDAQQKPITNLTISLEPPGK